MKREIIALAFGAKCEGFGRRSSGGFSPGLLGVAASSLSSLSRCARANAPMPKALLARNSRRDVERLDGIEELITAEELLAEAGERGQFVVGLIAARS